MKILLDENLPRRLAQLLPGHEVWTVPQRGWAGIKNGQLLELADAQFEVFVTMDRGIPYQQNMSGKRISLILLRAVSNRYEAVAPLAPFVVDALESIEPGQIQYVG